MNNLHPTLGAWIHHYHASMRKNQTKKDLFFLYCSPPPLNACNFGKKGRTIIPTRVRRKVRPTTISKLRKIRKLY